MTARILDGRRVAEDVLQGLADRVAALRERGAVPTLAFLLIGESPAAALYLKRLQRLAGRIGVTVQQPRIPETVSELELLHAVEALNADASIDGVLVQMPLPPHLSAAPVAAALDPRKDVDAITPHNVGLLYLGLPGPKPPTAAAMMDILDAAGVGVTGRHAVVVGRSNVVGHPVAEMLLQRDATLTVTHRQTADLASFTRQADILLMGAGDPLLIQPHMIKPGVVIIDAGINVTPHGVVGDVDFEGCLPVAGAITPVPGGVGPVTNAVLLRHVVESAERRP